MNHHRFTQDGSDALEKRLEDTCQEIVHDVSTFIPSHAIKALVLAGGYGRGEGGVLRTDDGDLPYNDLEFFLFLRGVARINEKRYGTAIHALEKKMTDKLGIDVEFKIASLEGFRNGPTTMFAYDLVEGHRVLMGDVDLFSSCDHHRVAAKIPHHEVTRLLMNRCSGLLFAKQRLLRGNLSEMDADFVYRNICKAKLALGDALLAMNGNYHWSCRERHLRLQSLENPHLPMQELRTLHQEGVAFKLHPTRVSLPHAECIALHEKVAHLAWTVFQHVEMMRLEKNILTPLDYTREYNKCPETSPWKNALIRLRTFGLSGWGQGHSFRYPREALFHALVVLLWSPGDLNVEWCSRQFVTRVQNWDDAVNAYQSLWCRFN